ncbi:ubiquitin carboxyl-terminal hydrolase 9-like isoform X1 [Cucurbita moschata]|uniref:Ubiquitin carboxyl-terminal hydrolase n=1 Tax=Cucurbita moschata TaxID=3662 RepID=A0A6J1ELM0_CUCMO|nr:ubiquitin carboxyl-terminal hydrolase 9-like isoform X1 [Cucurbita moschata]
MTVPASGFMMENGGSSCLPLPPDVENRIVTDLGKESESNLQEGNLYYVVSNRWFRRWQLYVGQPTEEFSSKDHSSDSQHCNMVPSNVVERPGPIDNSDIVVNGSDSENNDLELKRFLEERRDYVLVPSAVWEKLYDWYKGGPPLPRKLISQGVTQKNFFVEVYLLCLKLIDSRDGSECIIRLSKKATVFDLREKVFALKGIKQEKQACIWDYFNQHKQSVLDATSQTLEELNLQMDQHILLEVDGPTQTGMDATRNELALVALEPSRSSLSIAGGPVMSNGHSSSYGYQGSSLSSSVSDMDERSDLSNTAKKREKGGLAGLQNLGNTCFMNSALQCLVHTPPLVEYFLQDYSEEINADNPLGMHGELAIAFGDLLRKLWSLGQTTIAPRAFKGKLARFAPQFSGYNQHDSQELLAFLLDGLHEDLNRVKRKPYFETKDYDGRPDAEVADECWRYHRARNDSLIVDVCQGQYKSTLVCPVCGKISITFDPFMYLSLPLPSTVTRSVTVTVFYGDGSGLPMPYTVTVQRHGCIKDLTLALTIACCLKNDENLLLAEVYDHRIYKYFDNPLESVTSIKDEEYLVAYRLPKRESGRPKLEIIHRSLERCSTDRLKGMERKLFGTPLVTYLGEEFRSGADINAAVSKILVPLKRTYSSTKAHSSKENGFVSEMNDEPANCSPRSVSQSIDIEEEETSSENEPSFQLLLTDDRGLSCKPIDKDSAIKYGPLIKVFLDWTDREHELYDVSYIKDLPPVHQTRFMKKTRQEAISLFSCLEAFLTEEPLGPDDMWYCPRCKEHRQATKKLDLWKLPEIIVFHLKRFSYSRYLKNKLDTFVDFPIHNLDLSKYVKSNDGKSYLYNLYAISNHYGGLGGGHYTAYAKLIDEKRWYHFDDSHVSPVGEEEIKTSAAYLLFYQRVEN